MFIYLSVYTATVKPIFRYLCTDNITSQELKMYDNKNNNNNEEWGMFQLEEKATVN